MLLPAANACFLLPRLVSPRCLRSSVFLGTAADCRCLLAGPRYCLLQQPCFFLIPPLFSARCHRFICSLPLPNAARCYHLHAYRHYVIAYSDSCFFLLGTTACLCYHLPPLKTARCSHLLRLLSPRDTTFSHGLLVLTAIQCFCSPTQLVVNRRRRLLLLAVAACFYSLPQLDSLRYRYAAPFVAGCESHMSLLAPIASFCLLPPLIAACCYHPVLAFRYHRLLLLTSTPFLIAAAAYSCMPSPLDATCHYIVVCHYLRLFMLATAAARYLLLADDPRF